MAYSSAPFSIEGLGRATQTYHARIEQDPGNTSLRLNLAWMLVLQSFYAAGQEKGRSEFISASPDPDYASGKEIAADTEGATLLLKNCLQQVFIVSQLSASTQEKIEAEKLRRIIQLAEGEQALLEADQKATHTLMTIMRSLVGGRDGFEGE